MEYKWYSSYKLKSLRKALMLFIVFLIPFLFPNICSSANFIVTSALDNLGPVIPGSLRDAILKSNATPGPNTITFNIAPAGLNTITILGGLPVITQPVNIDGTTQPGWASGAPVVNISLTGGGNIFDLEAGSGGSTLKGFILSGGNRAILMNNSNGNRLSGNFIGTDPTGTVKGTAFATWALVEISNCNNTVIGGNQPQDRNIISGANEAGLRFGGTACTGTIIINNYIGTDKAGTAGPGNAQQGIIVGGNVNFSNSKIGGSTPDSLNIISKNGQQGILFGGGSNVTSNLSITGNYIGVDKTGNTALGNTFAGMEINNVSNLLIKNNVISGNQSGVLLSNSPTVTVKGNSIGVGIDKITSLPNKGLGIQANLSDGINIGGVLPADGNTISNNFASGISINNSSAPLINNNTVIGNLQLGMNILSSINPVIRNNTIANGGQDGINIGSGSNNALIEGNMIGMLADGITPAPNGGNGITVNLSLAATIGGLTPAQRNVISSNKGSGINITSGANNSIVEGNYVGLDATGLIGAGNLGSGIVVSGATGVTVGGTSFGARNIVSANKSEGIVFNQGANNGVIKGNFSGLNKNGSGSLTIGNRGAGILLADIVGATVGGPTLAERNVSSHNGFLNGDPLTAAGSDGIRVLGGSNLIIKGNYCGTDSTGLIAMGNSWGGISLNENFNSTIGGTGPGEFNVASGNLNEGIYIRNVLNTNPLNLSITGNYVGVGADGVTPVGNSDYGINITTGNNLNTTISQNIIAYTGKAPNVPSGPSSGNGGTGILVGGTSQYNLFTKNTIYCNVIGNLNLGTGNESVLAPTLDYTDNLVAKGTAAPGNTVEVFSNQKAVAAGCGCQGQTYVGSTIADASGNWTLTHNLGKNAASLNASQTTPLKSTSSFSPCCTPPTINLQPITQTACVGGTATFTGGSATGTIFKWVERKAGATSFTALTDGPTYSGTQTKVLKISAIPIALNKAEYRLVVYGCYPMDSSVTGVFLYLNRTKVTPNQTICSGQNATLTASGSTSYSWAPLTGLTPANGVGPTVSASPSSTTTYIVTGTNGNCIDTAQVTVVVASSLVVTIAPIAPAICQGDKITLTASGAASFVWSPSTGLSSTTTASVIANPTTTTTYTIIGTTGGCTGSTTVTVNVTPFVKMTATADQTICAGQSVTLKVLTSAPATTFNWTASSLTATSLSTAKTLIITPAATTTYYVTGKYGACTDSAKTTVTLGPNMILSVTPSLEVCSGDPATTLTASGATSYGWSPATGLSSTTGAVVSANPSNTTTYTVTGSNGICTASVTTTITVKPLPFINISSATFTICAGNSVQLLTTSDASVNSWSPAAGLDNSNALSPFASPSSNTNYTITGTTNGCSTQKSANVVVNPLPIITASPPTSVCKNASAVLKASGATSYLWSPALDLDVTTGNTVTTTPTASRLYTVKGTDNNSCVGSTTVQVNLLPNLMVSVNPVSKTICEGGSSVLTASGASSYSWTPASGATAAVSGANGEILTATPPPPSSTYKVVGTSAGCKDSVSVTIIVNPTPVITQPQDQFICSKGAFTIAINAPNVSSTNYSWTVSGASSTLTGSSNGTGAIIDTTSQPFRNYGNTAGIFTYSLNAIKNNCQAVPVKVNVTVYPIPDVIVSGVNPLCSGQSTAISLSSALSPVTFNWIVKSSNPSLISGQSDDINKSLISQTLKNAGTKADSIIYFVTAIKSNANVTCSSDPKPVKVVVNPLPVFTAITPYSICSASDSSILLNPTLTNTSFTWATAASGNVLGAKNGIGNPIPLQLRVNDGMDGMVKYTVTADLKGCSQSKDITVAVHPTPKIKLSHIDSLNFCAGKEAKLMANPPGSYTWNNAISGNINTVSVSGPYYCYTTNQYGCKGFSDTLVVNAYAYPKIIAGNDSSPVCIGKQVQLGSAGIVGYTYSWSSKPKYFSSQAAMPIATVQQETVFFLQASNKGCISKDSIHIKVVEDANSMYLPNAFSPNNDGLNDVYQVKASGISSFEASIFNRWGELIYQWKNTEGFWDGTSKDGIVLVDTYVYSIRAYGVCTSGLIKKIGTVTIVR
jgi:gliding motility-associated-like protein